MNLNLKDLYATLLAILAAAIIYARLQGIELPLISSGYRWAILALALIGVAMCTLTPLATAVNTGNMWSNPWIATSAVLGILALVLILIGLVTGTKLMFVLLGSTMLLLWFITTLRHLLQA